MIGSVASLDRQVFLFINAMPHPWWLVSVMMVLSGVGIAGMIWLFIGVIVVVREEVEDKRCLAALIIAAAVTRIGGDMGLKVLFGRLRPEYFLTDIFVLHAFPLDRFSFPSTHAMTAFAGAYILSREHPRWHAAYYCLAFCIAFSRVYLGYHYPLDVLSGGIIGVSVGYASLACVSYLQAYRRRIRHAPGRRKHS